MPDVNPKTYIIMKNTIKIILLTIFSVSLSFTTLVHAQEAEKKRVFSPFKVVLGGGLFRELEVVPLVGRDIYIEPKYAITDHIGVGFRAEVFTLSSSRYSNEGVAASFTNDYTFTTTGVRPSVGLRIGPVYLEGDGGTYLDIGTRAQVHLGPVLIGTTYHFVLPWGHMFIALNLGFELGEKRL